MSRTPWLAFAFMLLFAVVFFSTTVSSLPALVASHLDPIVALRQE